MKTLTACIKAAPPLPPGLGGVYLLAWPGGCYIGQTAQGFAKRWNEHLDGVRLGWHHNDKLRAAFKQYGDFTAVPLGIYPKARLLEWERFWIVRMRSLGYNVANER